MKKIILIFLVSSVFAIGGGSGIAVAPTGGSDRIGTNGNVDTNNFDVRNSMPGTQSSSAYGGTNNGGSTMLNQSRNVNALSPNSSNYSSNGMNTAPSSRTSH